jgi:hypothetical protein
VAAGHTTESQKQKFFQQAAQLGLVVRPTAIAGDAIPYSIVVHGRGPGGGWGLRVEHLSATLDGNNPIHVGGSMSSSGFGAGSFGSSVPCNDPGRHTLALTYRVQIFRGDLNFPGSPPGPPVYQKDLTMSGPCDVLPASTKDDIKLIDDTSLAAAIRASLRPHGFAIDRLSHTLNGQLEIKSPPINLAFDIFARWNGHEKRIGSVNMRQGNSTTFGWGDPGFTDEPAQIDLVLRSSIAEARRTVDLFSIWNGEIVIKDVPVELRPMVQLQRNAQPPETRPSTRRSPVR